MHRTSKVFAISAVLGVPVKNQVLTSPLTFPVPLLMDNNNNSTSRARFENKVLRLLKTTIFRVDSAY